MISDETADRMLSVSKRMGWSYMTTYPLFYEFMEAIPEDQRKVILKTLSKYAGEKGCHKCSHERIDHRTSVNGTFNLNYGKPYCGLDDPEFRYVTHEDRIPDSSPDWCRRQHAP